MKKPLEILICSPEWAQAEALLRLRGISTESLGWRWIKNAFDLQEYMVGAQPILCAGDDCFDDLPLFSRFSNYSDVVCFSYAAPWPHSAEHHARSLKNWEPI